MITENTSSSTNQSPTEGAEPSNENLQKQQVKGMSLLDIPVFTPSSSLPKESSSQTQETMPFTAPSSYDDGRVEYEYEFTCICTDSRPMFVGLWDTNDLSACQRVSACKMDKEEIQYDEHTGVGFFKTVDGLRWCFKREVYNKSYGPHNGVETGPEEKVQPKKSETADDILATL